MELHLSKEDLPTKGNRNKSCRCIHSQKNSNTHKKIKICSISVYWNTGTALELIIFSVLTIISCKSKQCVLLVQLVFNLDSYAHSLLYKLNSIIRILFTSLTLIYPQNHFEDCSIQKWLKGIKRVKKYV